MLILTTRKSTFYINIKTFKTSPMINLSDIEINKFELNELLSQYEKQAFKYLLKNGIYCNLCKDFCKVHLSQIKIYLDRFNDIKVVGQCTECNHEVTRIMEFGENESFFRKAVQFRNTRAVLQEIG